MENQKISLAVEVFLFFSFYLFFLWFYYLRLFPCLSLAYPRAAQFLPSVIFLFIPPLFHLEKVR